ncbi:MAG: hypothetical protein M1819_004803 [Sarea resinae]|nr:MAG: hypothetical protein M1819_004803 [Sarea resinae]
MSLPTQAANGHGSDVNGPVANGAARHGPRKSKPSPPGRSLLRQTAPEQLHDLVGVGFGPASLAIAVALHDSLESSRSKSGSASLDNKRSPKVAFLERQPQFAWHAGMLLPGAKMQITFIKDLATLRDPRSEFTFLNYLHRRDRLVQFTNLGTFLPLRVEYEDYMRWCAGWFTDVVGYGQEVLEIVPKQGSSSKVVDGFVVKARDITTGNITTRRARNVVIGVGGRPHIPPHFPQKHPRVIHSSKYSSAVPALLTDREKPYRIAVIGSGQSAAEIFNDLHGRYPNAKTSLIIKGSALKPSDDSPFVNEIFDPERVDTFYEQSPEIRQASLEHDRATNYGVVRLDLLERLYSDLYVQRLREPDEEKWAHNILNFRNVTKIEELPPAGESASHGSLRLHIQRLTGCPKSERASGIETMDVDAVLVATGYVRDAYDDMLQQARHLMPGGDEAGKKWAVGRDYRIQFQPGTVDENAGVWLQGCNERTHGV